MHAVKIREEQTSSTPTLCILPLAKLALMGQKSQLKDAEVLDVVVLGIFVRLFPSLSTVPFIFNTDSTQVDHQ